MLTADTHTVRVCECHTVSEKPNGRLQSVKFPYEKKVLVSLGSSTYFANYQYFIAKKSIRSNTYKYFFFHTSSGMIIMCGVTGKNNKSIELFALRLQTSALTSQPHTIITDTLKINDSNNNKRFALLNTFI